MSLTTTPSPTRCPDCGVVEATVICRWCQADKIRPGADEEFERPERDRQAEDHRLDDPRHGQARHINRR